MRIVTKLRMEGAALNGALAFVATPSEDHICPCAHTCPVLGEPDLGYLKIYAETGSNSVRDAASPAGRCMSVFWQLAREKSLIPKCSEIRGNSSDISKGIFQNDIRKFESCRPSHPVRSPPTFT
jgi:hypothetical protein